METYWTVTMAPNPLGSKGIGEAATIGLTPAIVNAVEDALSHLGVEISETPLTPGGYCQPSMLLDSEYIIIRPRVD
jgi:carbon-monoxide dehydrogenase large subunit